jgi:hypothetical protein
LDARKIFLDNAHLDSSTLKGTKKSPTTKKLPKDYY